jgi:hypothetical protein
MDALTGDEQTTLNAVKTWGFWQNFGQEVQEKYWKEQVRQSFKNSRQCAKQLISPGSLERSCRIRCNI